MTTPDRLPDITRPDAGLVLFNQWSVGTPERQRAAVQANIIEGEQAPWPESLLSLSSFVSTDGETS
jgi:hypothetical protein